MSCIRPGMLRTAAEDETAELVEEQVTGQGCKGGLPSIRTSAGISQPIQQSGRAYNTQGAGSSSTVVAAAASVPGTTIVGESVMAMYSAGTDRCLPALLLLLLLLCCCAALSHTLCR